MTKRAILTLATVLLVLAAFVVWGGSRIRDTLLAMHGRGGGRSSAAHAASGGAKPVRAAVRHGGVEHALAAVERVTSSTGDAAGAAAQRPPAAARAAATTSTARRLESALAVGHASEPDPDPAAPAGSGSSVATGEHLVELGRQWAAAFSSGEADMRAFLLAHMAEGSLEARGIDERLKGYRGLAGRFGSLRPGEVRASAPGTVEMILVAADGSEHEFIFTGQTEAPFKLLSVAFRELRHGH